MEMARVDTGEKCFTFIWSLQNASYCVQRKGDKIFSPSFMVDEINETKWRISLYPKGDSNGNYISLCLRRELDGETEESVEIEYELEFIGESGLAVTSHDRIQHSFAETDEFGFAEFLKREDVFILMRSAFLPKDTLTIRCRIWKMHGELQRNVQCFARTIIEIEKRSFVWKLENFSTLEPDAIYTYPIKSLEKNTDLMFLYLSLTSGQNCEELMHFQLGCSDLEVKYCALGLSIVDANGRAIGCNQDEFEFDEPNDIQKFTFLFSRQMLLQNKTLYLPEDVLSLQWEFTFSRGVLSSKIEYVQCGCIVPVTDFRNRPNDQQ